MNTDKKQIKIKNPIEQTKLYGYEEYFNSFNTLYRKNALPNSILLSGPKGIGKSTFVYHFINFLLSINDDKSYSFKKFSINEENRTYNLIKNSIHPNFYLLDNYESDQIKIEQVRNFLKFNNKSTYSRSVKFVLIDNAEKLNINSANALLKTIEEPSKDTFFFIIHNSNSKLLNTIKSRCVEFKINFSGNIKTKIFREIVKDYDLEFLDEELESYIYFETPGGILRLFSTLKHYNIKFTDNTPQSIIDLMELYKKNNDNYLLKHISLLIENFYKNLFIKNNDFNIDINRSRISNLIHDAKKYNLDKKNLIISIDRILRNEYSLN